MASFISGKQEIPEDILSCSCDLDSLMRLHIA